MGEVAALPMTGRAAYHAISVALEHGEFAISPPNVPSTLWRDAGRQVARNANVPFEFRVDPKTDHCLLRLNRGFPLGMRPYTPEAHEWARNKPAWRSDQRAWHDTARVRC